MKNHSRKHKNRKELNKRRIGKSKKASTELVNKMLVARWIKFEVASGILANRPESGNRRGKRKRSQEALYKAEVPREEEVVVDGVDLHGEERAEVVTWEMENHLTQPPRLKRKMQPHPTLTLQQ